MTIVQVTHSENQASYGTRVVRFEDGRITEDGPAPERPAPDMETSLISAGVNAKGSIPWQISRLRASLLCGSAHLLCGSAHLSRAESAFAGSEGRTGKMVRALYRSFTRSSSRQKQRSARSPRLPQVLFAEGRPRVLPPTQKSPSLPPDA